MKIQHYLFTLIVATLLISCQKENQAPFIPTNHLAEFSNEESQFVDLDMIEYKKIVGKHGTVIFYDRDLFELKETEKVQLELIELYDYNEILYRNIQTLTTDNKLLETSGVLKIVFTSNGKELKLKKGEKLIVYPPKGKLKDNDIFLSETDSLGSIKWEITDQKYVKVLQDLGGGITKSTTIHRDSLDEFRKKQQEYWRNRELEIEYQNKLNRNYFILTKNNYQWINIDKLALIKDKINVNFKCNNNKIGGFNIYLVYEKLDAFIVYQRNALHLNFEKLPICGKTHLIFIGGNDDTKVVYYDKIELNQSLNNIELNLDLKKISKEKLKNLFKK